MINRLVNIIIVMVAIIDHVISIPIIVIIVPNYLTLSLLMSALAPWLTRDCFGVFRLWRSAYYRMQLWYFYELVISKHHKQTEQT